MARARPLLCCLAAGACATLAPESRDNAVRGPPVERCTRQTDPLLQQGCLRARDKAHGLMQAVHQGDSLCVDPLLSPDLDNCRARSIVEDQDPVAMKLRFIEVDPGSSWAARANTQSWFENAYLMDLYLEAKGF
ncbi:MAG: hypothetical protein ACYDCL_06875 [Myxococcales bacterium]